MVINSLWQVFAIPDSLTIVVVDRLNTGTSLLTLFSSEEFKKQLDQPAELIQLDLLKTANSSNLANKCRANGQNRALHICWSYRVGPKLPQLDR